MDEYIEIAYKQALKSNVNKQYGAVIVYRNKIISSGYNFKLRPSTKYKSCVL
jgi:deoxycytidylate deaminase